MCLPWLNDAILVSWPASLANFKTACRLFDSVADHKPQVWRARRMGLAVGKGDLVGTRLARTGPRCGIRVRRRACRKSRSGQIRPKALRRYVHDVPQERERPHQAWLSRALFFPEGSLCHRFDL